VGAQAQAEVFHSEKVQASLSFRSFIRKFAGKKWFMSE
jgi:hypothetical protein